MGADLEVAIRALRVADAQAAAALETEVFPGEAWSEALVEAELANRWSHYLGAFAGAQLVGYGGIKGDREGDLMTLGVAGAWRRRGLGRQLLARLCEVASRVGMEKLFLEVRASNGSAIDLYRAAGFEVTGRIPGYYRGPAEDALLMVRPIP